MTEASIEKAARLPKARGLREDAFNLPNLLTMLRIAMIPVVMLMLQEGTPAMNFWAGWVYTAATITDALDGYLARKQGLVSVVGKFLDPLADKLIVLSTLVVLVAKGRAPAWLVVILLSRELAVTGLRSIASQAGLVIAAGRGGKMKTALQLVGISFLLLHFPYDILFFDYELDFHQVGIYLLYVSLVLSITSAVEYFRFFTEAAAKQASELAAQGITREALRDRARRRRAKLRALEKQRKKRLREERRAQRLGRRGPRRKRRK